MAANRTTDMPDKQKIGRGASYIKQKILRSNPEISNLYEKDQDYASMMDNLFYSISKRSFKIKDSDKWHDMVPAFNAAINTTHANTDGFSMEKVFEFYEGKDKDSIGQRMSRSRDVAASRLQQSNPAAYEKIFGNTQKVEDPQEIKGQVDTTEAKGEEVLSPKYGVAPVDSTEEPDAAVEEPSVSATKNESPSFHKVKENDTLYSLSKKYGMSVKDLKRINDLDGDKIVIGETLSLVDKSEIEAIEEDDSVKFSDVQEDIIQKMRDVDPDTPGGTLTSHAKDVYTWAKEYGLDPIDVTDSLVQYEQKFDEVEGFYGIRGMLGLLDEMSDSSGTEKIKNLENILYKKRGEYVKSLTEPEEEVKDIEVSNEKVKRAIGSLKESTPSHVKEFFETRGDKIVEMSDKAGVLPSVVMAQAMLESGYGGSFLSTRAKNYFGHKYAKSGGKEGDDYVIAFDDKPNDKFVVYPSFEASLSTHLNKLSQNPRYSWMKDIPSHFGTEHQYKVPKTSKGYDTINYKGKKVKKGDKITGKPYELWAAGLKFSGYATSPNYSDKIIKLIERYNLDQLDDNFGVQPPKVPSTGKKEKADFLFFKN